MSLEGVGISVWFNFIFPCGPFEELTFFPNLSSNKKVIDQEENSLREYIFILFGKL